SEVVKQHYRKQPRERQLQQESGKTHQGDTDQVRFVFRLSWFGYHLRARFGYAAPQRPLMPVRGGRGQPQKFPCPGLQPIPEPIRDVEIEGTGGQQEAEYMKRRNGWSEGLIKDEG